MTTGKKFRVVQIGCGSMGKRWIKYALSRPDLELVGLVDIHLPAAQAAAEEHGLAIPCFTELDEALKATQPDLVFDVTIPEARMTVVKQALEAGCHVISEKPMALNMEEASEMLRLVNQHKRSYSIMQNRRYGKEMRMARALIEAGTIGKVGFTTAQFFIGPHFGGFREAMEHPLLLDMAIHTFDQARYLLQADPVSVYCQAFNPPYSWYDGAACATCIFEMSDGSIFTYNGSWCAEGAPTSWQCEWRISGSKGTLICDGIHDPYCEVVAETEGFLRKSERVEFTGEKPTVELHDACFDEMLAALHEGRRSETDCSDNVKSLAMVFGAIESAETGKKVAITFPKA